MRARGSSAGLTLVPVLAIALAACFQPEVATCRVTCEDSRCPLGLMCMGDGYCHRAGDPADLALCGVELDASVVDGGGPDAAVQARVLAMAAGDHHVCVVDADTRLVCWGDNRRAQLGLGNARPRVALPEVIGEDNVWSDVDAGHAHTCAAKNGELYCWGNNDSGQAGQSVSTVLTPSLVPSSLGGWTQVATGAAHSCGIREVSADEHRLYCWGSDAQGQLGDGAPVNSGAIVREIAATSDGTHTDWVQVVAGYDHTCARRRDGQAYCWGLNDHGQLGDGSVQPRVAPVRVMPSTPDGVALFYAIDAGAAATCALGQSGGGSDGELYCWGDNSGNLLGLAGVSETSVPRRLPGGGDWGSFSVGLYSSCGARGDGVWCWGNGYSGAIGDDRWSIAATPTQVSGLTGQFDVTVGTDYACAAAHAGGVWCWGGNSHGELGDGSVATKYAPVGVGAIGLWSSIAAGETHTCGTRAGELWCWGWNESAQLGLAGISAAPLPTEIVDAGTPGGSWVTVAVGHRTTCAIENDGTGTMRLWCWGFDSEGQTGQGASGPRSPIEIAPGVGGWHDLTMSGNTACALSGTNRYCWGQQINYGLGNNSTAATGLLVPTLINDGPWAQLSVGSQFGCGLRTINGQVLCWGADDRGQQGNGAGVSARPTPLVVGNMTASSTVAAGFRGDHVCAIADSSLFCWGRNTYGQAAVNGGADVLSATVVWGTLVEQLSAGARHTLALDDGRLSCWGDNSTSQCGDEAIGTAVSLPTQIGTWSDWDLIDAGTEHSCGIRSGNLYCWGGNVHGQIGDGTSAHGVPMPAVLPATTAP